MTEEKIIIVKPKPDERVIIETKTIEAKDGSLYEINKIEIGDKEIISNLNSVIKQLENWQNVNAAEYIANKIVMAQKEVDKWQARKIAMNLTEEEWNNITE